MNPDWIRKAAALPARQLHLMGIGLLLVVGAALWFYALRAPLEALRTVRAEQARLALAGGDPRPLAAQLEALTADTQVLARQLGIGPARPSAQLMVGLIGELGKLARTHGVTLHGATPAPEETVLAFTQTGFDAQVTGSYEGLLAWIAAIESAQPNLSVARFEMRPAKTPGQVDMNVRIAALQPLESTP